MLTGIRCDCGTELNLVDLDLARRVGICPSCGNLVREGSDATPPTPQLVAPASNRAHFSPFRDAAVPESAKAPLVPQGASAWTERALTNDSIEIALTSRPLGSAARFVLGVTTLLIAIGLLGRLFASGADLGFGLSFVAGFVFMSVWLFAKAVRGRARIALRFEPGALELRGLQGVVRFRADEIIEFTHPLLEVQKPENYGRSRQMFEERLELRTTRGPVRTPIVVHEYRDARALTTRLNELARSIRE